MLFVSLHHETNAKATGRGRSPQGDIRRDERTRLSCRAFAANALRRQLHALDYKLGNFMRTLAIPKTVERWTLTTCAKR